MVKNNLLLALTSVYLAEKLASSKKKTKKRKKPTNH